MGRAQSPEQASALPPLPQVAQDVASPSAQVRRQALRGLRELGGPETLPLLAALLSDAEIDIREGALAGVIGVYVQPLPNRSIDSAEEAFEAARFHDQPWSVPPELSTALVKALADEQPSVRRDAAYAVGIVLTPPVTDLVAFEILASLSDTEPSVRVAAARALGRLRVQGAGVPLIGRVNDEDLDVRLASMRALGDLRYDPAVVALTDQFTFYVRGVAGRSAISALAAIGHASTIPLFEAQTTSGIQPTEGRRTKAWRSRVAPPLRRRASKRPWPRRKTRGYSSRWLSHLHQRVAMASTVCWTLLPIAIGVTTHWRTWWSLGSRTSRLSRRGSAIPTPSCAGRSQQRSASSVDRRPLRP